MSVETKCAECGGASLYRNRGVPSGGGYGPQLLPQLGSLFVSAKFTIHVCADCGLTRFFADKDARSRLAKSSAWTRVP